MFFKRFTSLFAVLMLVAVVLTCSIVIMNVCPNIGALCAEFLALPSTSPLQVTFAVFLAGLIGFRIELIQTLFTRDSIPLVLASDVENRDIPLFLLNEVYRL